MVKDIFLHKQYSASKQNSPDQFQTYMNDHVLPTEHGGMVLASDDNIYEFEFDDKGNAYSPYNIPKYDYYGGYSFIGHVDDFSPAKDIIISEMQKAISGNPTLTGSAVDAYRRHQLPRQTATLSQPPSTNKYLPIPRPKTPARTPARTSARTPARTPVSINDEKDYVIGTPGDDFRNTLRQLYPPKRKNDVDDRKRIKRRKK